MNIVRSLIIVIIPFFFLSGCKSTQHQNSLASLENEILTYFNADFDKIPSPDNQRLLAYIMDSSSGITVLKFGVWNVKTKNLIYSGSAIRGEVSWLDNYNLLIYDYPGIIDEESSFYKYRIDLKTKSKVKINDTEEF